MNETKLELRQPFTPTLNQLSLHTLSQQPQKGQFSSQQVGHHNFYSIIVLEVSLPSVLVEFFSVTSSLQTHLSWKSAVPVNVSVILNKQWQSNSSRGQACALFSTQQVGAAEEIFNSCESIKPTLAAF